MALDLLIVVDAALMVFGADLIAVVLQLGEGGVDALALGGSQIFGVGAGI